MVKISRENSLLKFILLSFLSKVSLTSWIILVNVLIFFVFLITSLIYPGIIDYSAIQPAGFVNGKVWTLVTSIFLHAGFVHLFVNMFSLFFLGRFTEQIIGQKRYLFLYLASGIFGGLAFVGFAFLGSFIPRGEFLFGGLGDYAVGASGAIFGLLGLLSVLIPRYKVYLIAGPIILAVVQFVISGIAMPSFLWNILMWGITALFVLMLFGMFSNNSTLRKLAVPIAMPLWIAPIAAIVPLVLISFFVKLPIGNSAHLGGLIVGLAYGVYLRLSYPNKVAFLGRAVRGRV